MLQIVINKLYNFRARLLRKSVDEILSVFTKTLKELEKTRDMISKDIVDLDVEINNLQSVQSIAVSEYNRAETVRKKLSAFLN